MAVTKVTGLTDEYRAGFASNNVKMQDTSSYDYLRCRMRDKHTTGFVVYGNEYGLKDSSDYAYFNLKDLQATVLTSYDNLVTLAPAAGAFNVSETWDEHAKKVVFYWNDLTPFSPGSYSSNDIYIIKAANIYFSNWSGATDVYNPKRQVDSAYRRHAFSSQVIPFTLFSQKASEAVAVYKDGVLGLSQTMTFTNGYGCILYTPGSESLITLGSGDYLESIYIDHDYYERSKVLYFLNESGAWDWYCFIDYEATDYVNKNQYEQVYNEYGDSDVAQNTIDKIKEMKLYGKAVSPSYFQIINDLFTSPVVLDENGDRVLIKEKKIKYISREILEPQITISYKASDVING